MRTEIQDRTNDFAFKIATVNGTGSASANGLLIQAIFPKGVPVSGKNVFPSNIQGLPTWYEIRVSRHGYTARTPEFDLIVAIETIQDVPLIRSEDRVIEARAVHVLDAREDRVDLSPAAAGRVLTRQGDRDPGRRGNKVVDEVDPLPARDRVGT